MFTYIPKILTHCYRFAEMRQVLNSLLQLIVVGFYITERTVALRNQPYIPLYVQDYLTDEKLNECCAASQGIYIKILCLMHKSEPYGTILLKQKDKQAPKLINNFAYKLAKHLLFTQDEIEKALIELLQEKVLQIEGDVLSQKRMIKDNNISLLRSKAGKKGGEKTQQKEGFASRLAKAKTQANSEYETESENESDISLKEVLEYFEFQNCPEYAQGFYDHFNAQDWLTGTGRVITNWRSKANQWIKKELHIKAKDKNNERLPKGAITGDNIKTIEYAAEVKAGLHTK